MKITLIREKEQDAVRDGANTGETYSVSIHCQFTFVPVADNIPVHNSKI